MRNLGSEVQPVKNEHKKKIVAPAVVTVLFLAYLVAYGIAIATVSDWILLVFSVPLIGLGAGMVYSLVSRIKEIRSGEEDDLGNY